MKKIHIWGISVGCFVLGLGVAFCWLFFYHNPSSQSDLANEIDAVNESVVDIVVTQNLSGLQRAFFSGEENTDGTSDIGGGTGFFVRADGLIVTNNHLLQGESYTAITASGSELAAEIVARFPDVDIAFFDVAGDDYQPVTFSDVAVKPGTAVFAIGNSLGYYTHSAKAGMISKLDRAIEKDGREYLNMLQLYMAITNGDSGGPVFDQRGLVVGMMTALDNRAGNISFAIPAWKIQEKLKGI